MIESQALEPGVTVPDSEKFSDTLFDIHLEWFTNPESRAWKRIIGINFFIQSLKDPRNDPDYTTSDILISQLDEIMSIDYDGLEGSPADKRNFYKLCSELSLALLGQLRDREGSDDADDTE